jgi:predicted ATPase/class 3 adenylate cyclase
MLTLLFTDIEGSTRLLHQLGDDYPALLAEHRSVLRQVFSNYGGVEVDTQGDAFFIVFGRAIDGVNAARDAQRHLVAHTWPGAAALRVRMGLHSGTPTLSGGGYVGIDVHRAARLCSAGHGGQVLISESTRELVLDSLPTDVSLLDLGQHRLKDLQHAEQIYQLVIADLPASFPPPRTLSARWNNLPRQATPLVGRERELDTTRQILLRPDVRLLTLTGPGGTGKTRLCLQLAADLLEHFADGVCFVPLASISDPALVPSAIAQALAIQEAAGRPPLDTLQDYLRQKEVLLCLDNFEHLLSAARAVAHLLTHCARLKVLATSRAALHVYGEHHVEVPPLGLPSRAPLPPLDQLPRYEAVRLFIDRAQAVHSNFTLDERNCTSIVEICHRLDGLPLGIELAAARIRLLPPETMLVRMERRLPLLTGGPHDVPERHQTLRNAIAWSYDLLPASEQTLFRRLPVFAGGCTLEAAESICAGFDGVMPAVDVLNGVDSLLDKSLLTEAQRDGAEPRLLMLETIREYGLEQLERTYEANEVRLRHAQFYLELAESAEPQLHGPDQVTWLDRLEAEHDNLRSVHSWSQTDARHAQLGLRLASALLWFWAVRGYFDEGWRAINVALDRASDVTLNLRVKALCAAGHLAQYQGAFERSIALLQDAVALARAANDSRGEGVAGSLLGETMRLKGDLVEGVRVLRESLVLQRQLGDHWGMYHTLYRLGEAARVQGNLAEAAALHEESLALRQQRGDTRAIAAAYKSLGLVALAERNFKRAERYLKRGLEVYRGTRNKLGIANCIEALAEIALARGQAEDAVRLLGAVEALLIQVGRSVKWIGHDRFERDRAVARARLEEAAFAAAHTQGQTMTLDEAVDYALGDALASVN